MSTTPRKVVDRIQWCEDHHDPFNDNAVAIGTTVSAVTDLQTKTATARDAYNTAQQTRQAAEAATTALGVAVDVMDVAVASILKQIRAKADLAGPGIFALANVPPNATPSPIGAPGTPSNFKIELQQSGAVTLKFKCKNPAGSTGIQYNIRRRVNGGGSSAFVGIGQTGIKSWTDATIPAGSTSVTYEITASRSTSVGSPAFFDVNFGLSASGEMTATVAPKLAA
jgi:hypothetical protein